MGRRPGRGLQGRGTGGAGVLFPVQAYGETGLKVPGRSGVVALARERPLWTHSHGGDGTRQAGSSLGPRNDLGAALARWPFPFQTCFLTVSAPTRKCPPRESSRTETSQSPPLAHAPKSWGQWQRDCSSLVIVGKRPWKTSPSAPGGAQAPVAPKWVRRVLSGSAAAPQPHGASSLHSEDVGVLSVTAADRQGN